MPEQELRIEVLLEEVIKRRASDLHIQVGLPPMLRIDGTLIAIAGFDALDEAQVESLVFAILDEDQQQILLKDKEFTCYDGVQEQIADGHYRKETVVVDCQLTLSMSAVT